jgi:hypothetical protein
MSESPRFTVEKVFPIAMLQIESVLKSDVDKLNDYINKKRKEFEKYSDNNIWIAYERCGFNPEGICSYIDSGANLKIIDFHVKEDEWEALTDSRKESLRSIFQNPNTFLYRSRPPGEKAPNGPWSSDEIEAFHRRLLFFRHFGVQYEYWGLFSVPLKRCGYSCASFAKSFNPDEHPITGTIEYPDIPKHEIYNYLVREAVDKIISCLKSCKSLGVNSLFPIFSVKAKSSKPKQSDSTLKSKTKQKKGRSFLKSLDYSDLILTKKDFNEARGKRRNKKIKQAKHRNKSVSKEISPPISQPEGLNLARGAIDAITKKPMRDPYMNRDGYVFDYKTWNAILNGEVDCPYAISTLHSSDLTQVTEDNFDSFKPFMRNVYF